MAPKRGYLRLESMRRGNGSPKDEHRMVLGNFSPPSVIMCHHSIGVVPDVGRSVLLKIKSVKCIKKDPAHTAKYRRVSRVRRNHP
jgi:hypothetical protein